MPDAVLFAAVFLFIRWATKQRRERAVRKGSPIEVIEGDGPRSLVALDSGAVARALKGSKKDPE